MFKESSMAVLPEQKKQRDQDAEKISGGLQKTNIQDIFSVLEIEKEEYEKEKTDKSFSISEIISSWSKEYLEHIYENGFPEEKGSEFIFDGQRMVTGNIAKITGEQESFSQGRLNPKYRNGVYVFLQELINFVSEKSTKASLKENGGQKEKLNIFLDSIQDRLFSYSPNISSQTGIKNLFFLTAKANRVQDVQGWFGQTVVGELVYELSYCDDRIISDIVDDLDNQKTEEVLDMIQQCQTIGASAIANGDWALPALDKIRHILAGVGEKKFCPLINYAGALALQRVFEEQENPSIGVVTYHGNKNAGRLNEMLESDLSQQSDRFIRQIKPNVDLASGDKMLKISSDAMGIMDHSNLMYFLGKINPDNLPEPIQISPVDIQMALDALNSRHIESPVFLDKVRMFLKERLLFENIEKTSAESLIEELNEMNKEADKKLLAINFVPIKSIDADVNINPFENNDGSLSLLLQHLHRPELKKLIERDLNISFENMPLRAQAHFIRFLSQKDPRVFYNLKDVLNNNEQELSQKITLSFLACAEDLKNGETILKLAKTLDKKSLDKILDKYLEITTATENIEEYLVENFRGEINSGSKIHKATKSILSKANDILALFVLKIESGGEMSSDDIVSELEKIKTDILVFKSIFRAIIKEHPEINFDYFRSLDFRIYVGEEVADDDKSAMMAITEKNYGDMEERKIALAGLDKGLQNKNTVFYILRYKGQIVSFLRFDRDSERDCSYLGSFNTNPDFQQAYIGEAVMKECLSSELASGASALEAHAFPDKKITSKYIEDIGFIIEDMELNYMNTGKNLFKITRDDRINKQYKYRGPFETDIKKEFEALAENFTGSAIGKPFLKVGVDKLGDSAVLEKIKAFMKKHNFVITRYFPDNKERPNYFTMVFEEKIKKMDVSR